jgi:hypothetical protein
MKVSNVVRPEGGIVISRASVPACVAVALGALAIGLSVWKRDWRIGAGLGAGAVVMSFTAFSFHRKKILMDAGRLDFSPPSSPTGSRLGGFHSAQPSGSGVDTFHLDLALNNNRDGVEDL